MKAYPEDLRERVVRAVEADRPREEVAVRFAVSVPTIERWVRLKRETGGLARRPVPGPAAVKAVGLLEALLERLTGHADATLAEQCAWWHEVSGWEVSPATMSLALTRLGWKRKIRRLGPASRTPRHATPGGTRSPRSRPRSWRSWTRWAATGATSRRTPGRRAASGSLPPRNPGEHKTVIAALTLDGVRALMRFDGGMTSARFEGYVRHVLAPTLRPGQVVVADNLRAHHAEDARAAIEACGARFLPPPSYSPDFNPIEHACSKVKQALRRAQARTDDALRAATRAAFATITPADAAGWFAHCDDPASHQPS